MIKGVTLPSPGNGHHEGTVMCGHARTGSSVWPPPTLGGPSAKAGPAGEEAITHIQSEKEERNRNFCQENVFKYRGLLNASKVHGTLTLCSVGKWSLKYDVFLTAPRLSN